MIGVQRAELTEQLARLRERRAGRNLEPSKLRWIDNADRGEVECERREIGFEDLGSRAIQ